MLDTVFEEWRSANCIEGIAVEDRTVVDEESGTPNSLLETHLSDGQTEVNNGSYCQLACSE